MNDYVKYEGYYSHINIERQNKNSQTNNRKLNQTFRLH